MDATIDDHAMEDALNDMNEFLKKETENSSKVCSDHPPQDTDVMEHELDDESSSSDSEEDDDGTQIGLSVRQLYSMMVSGASPRGIIQQLFGVSEAEMDNLKDFEDSQLWRMLFESVSRRQKLRQYNTVIDAVELIKKSSKIIVLTGAGVSVSCGIPDFRSSNGIYSRLKEEFPDLKDPTHMFNIQYFRSNPQPFFSFAKELYPGKFQPSITHRFIKELEARGKLLRNYTQNIDTLEKQVGIENVVLCHGSFATATCLICKHSVDSDFIKSDVLESRIPKCRQCPEPAPLSLYKPDIVFFGEDLPPEYYATIERDKTECDLLIVIGTSLKVHPVAGIPRTVAGVPQIIINREPVSDHRFDIELLGDADIISQQLAHLLSWDDLKTSTFRPLVEISREAAREQYRTGRNPDPVTPEDYDIVALREMFDSRNMAAWLPEGGEHYMFVPPSRYVFPGAMVLERDRRGPREPFGEQDDDSSSSSSSNDDSDEEIRDEMVGKNDAEDAQSSADKKND